MQSYSANSDSDATTKYYHAGTHHPQALLRPCVCKLSACAGRRRLTRSLTRLFEQHTGARVLTPCPYTRSPRRIPDPTKNTVAEILCYGTGCRKKWDDGVRICSPGMIVTTMHGSGAMKTWEVGAGTCAALAGERCWINKHRDVQLDDPNESFNPIIVDGDA